MFSHVLKAILNTTLFFSVILLSSLNPSISQAAPTLRGEVTVKSSIYTGGLAFPAHNGSSFFRFDEGYSEQSKIVFLDKNDFTAQPYKVSIDLSKGELINLIDSPSGRYTIIQKAINSQTANKIYLIDAKMKTEEEVSLTSVVSFVAPSISNVRFSHSEKQVALFSIDKIILLNLNTKVVTELESIPEANYISTQYIDGYSNNIYCQHVILKPCANYDLRFSSDEKKIELIGGLINGALEGVAYFSWDLESKKKLDFHVVKKGRIFNEFQAKFISDDTILVKMLDDSNSKVIDIHSNQQLLKAKNISFFAASRKLLIDDGVNFKSLDAFSLQTIFETEIGNLHLQSYSSLMLTQDTLVAFQDLGWQSLSKGLFRDITLYTFNGPQVNKNRVIGSYSTLYFSRIDQNEYVSADRNLQTGEISFKFYKF